MDKYDLKRSLKTLYSAPQQFTVVEVPEASYLAIDGAGNPNTSKDYAAAIEALFSLSYTLKFASKSAGRDFVVGPLEGLWKSEQMSSFVTREKDLWQWTAMICQPKWITASDVASATETVSKRKSLSALPLVRLITLAEGTSVQILHVGSYDDEAPMLAALHETFMPENGFAFNGDHHEIYLSDARKIAPEKLKTIVRQPVRLRSP
jgi:hypothetical protein